MWTLKGTAVPCCKVGVTTYLKEFVTNSDSSTGCRALLRHSRDENALEDKWGLVHKSTSRGKHLLLMAVKGAKTPMHEGEQQFSRSGRLYSASGRALAQEARLYKSTLEDTLTPELA